MPETAIQQKIFLGRSPTLGMGRRVNSGNAKSRLDFDDKVPDHSTFSVNRDGRFRDSDLLRQVFEAVVRACMDAGARALPLMPAS
jgi:hypothetical protein